jgi:uncharacterized damage-inducible protein DinB
MDTILVNLTAVLKTTPQRWHQLTQNFSDDLLRRKPLEGEWSALECLLHLIDIDNIFFSRVQSFLAGEDFAAFDPDKQGTKLSDTTSPADVAKQFDDLRTDSLKLIATITPDDLSREASHSELGLVTLGQMLHEWGGHDLMHIVQAERAMMQPFIDGCGAWKPYFADHIAK